MLGSRAVVLGQGHFCSPDDIYGDIVGCHSSGSGTDEYQVRIPLDILQHTDGPTTQKDPSPNAKSDEPEEPGLELLA